jgi:hypothetical protein
MLLLSSISREVGVLVELNAVLEGQPILHANALEQSTVDAYPRVLGVHFLYNLVQSHSCLTGNKATKQLVSFQDLHYIDRGKLLSLLILLSLCLAF